MEKTAPIVVRGRVTDPSGNPVGGALLDIWPEAAVISCRQLRAQLQHTAKNLASLQAKQARQVKGSRRWEKLQRRTRDIEPKVSREVVDWAIERKVGTLAIGEVRDVADGTRLNRKSQQKLSQWGHGQMRAYSGCTSARLAVRWPAGTCREQPTCSRASSTPS